MKDIPGHMKDNTRISLPTSNNNMNKGKLVVVESDKYQSKNRCGINELIKINLNEHWTKSQFFNSIDFYKQKIDQQTQPQTTGE